MAQVTITDAHRKRILKVALALLMKEGRDAVTTRKVAEAAKVQPPVLYRIFGDKTGLLDAVAAYGFEAYIAKKYRPAAGDDPVETLRTGWATHVEFGLANPELYLLMYANPRPGAESPAARHSFEMLGELMQSVATAGRLRVSVTRACALYYAAAVGVVMTLLASLPEQRDFSLSIAARDHALSGITTDASDVSTPTIAITANRLHAVLTLQGEATSVLTDAERLLLSEWLLRLTEQKGALV
jgi:AcrR family transcriptional regulator